MMNKDISVNSEMFDSWQYNSDRSAPQSEFNIFVTTATDPPDIKGFSGHLKFLYSILPIVPHLHDPTSIY